MFWPVTLEPSEPMQLKLNTPLLDIDGKPAENLTDSLGQVLSRFLALDAKSEDPVKYYGWAIKLRADEAIDLDRSDEDAFKAFVKTNPSITNLVKAQVLIALSEQKDK